MAVYDRVAGEWQASRGDANDDLGAVFRSEIGAGVVVDLGCGPGRYLAQLAGPVIGLDASRQMLALAQARGTPLVQADLESLPFRDGSLHGAFARHSYLHLPADRLAAALGELRRVLRPGGRMLLSLIGGSYEGRSLPDDDFPGRYFAFWAAEGLSASLERAGFVECVVEEVCRRGGEFDLVAKGRV